MSYSSVSLNLSPLPKNMVELFPNYSVQGRLDKLLESHKALGADILSYSNVSLLIKRSLVFSLKELGYTVLESDPLPNNQVSEDLGAYFLTAYNPKRLVLLESKTIMIDIPEGFEDDCLSAPPGYEEDEVSAPPGFIFQKEGEASPIPHTLVCAFKSKDGIIIHSSNLLNSYSDGLDAYGKVLAEQLNLFTSIYQAPTLIVQGSFGEAWASFDDPLITQSDISLTRLANSKATYVAYPFDLGPGYDWYLDTLLSTNSSLSPMNKLELLVQKTLSIYGKARTSIKDYSYIGGLDVKSYKQSVDMLGYQESEITDLFNKQSLTGKPFMLSDHFAVILTWSY